jgi:hypothetical protein
VSASSAAGSRRRRLARSPSARARADRLLAREAGPRDTPRSTPRALPAGVETGAKWALLLSELQALDEEIDLARYEVAVGSSEGRPATAYLQGQSGKAA